jgi:hypothetical protein
MRHAPSLAVLLGALVVGVGLGACSDEVGTDATDSSVATVDGGARADSGGSTPEDGGTTPERDGGSTPRDGGSTADDVYFRMDYAEAAAPTGGWSLGFIDPESLLGVQYFSTLVPGAGPSGQNVYRTRLAGGGRTEFGIGFHGHPYNAAQRGPGTEVFTRFRFRANGDILQNGYRGQKIIMVFPENPGPAGRIGLLLNPWEDGYVWRGSHGGDLICQTPEYADWDEWSNVQVSWTFETSTGNGSVRIWRNNNDYEAPTASSIGDVVVMPGEGDAPYYYVFNGYQVVAPDADASFEITDFEIGPTFRAM